jgi:glycosyltransferase involved in cell wall biosynthesis
LKTFVERHGLHDVVDLPGSVDFYDRLLPEIKQGVDVFVMLHRQSDPSCTYLETLSCGVPIVGYTNRAFAGLLELADIGWGAEMDDLEAVADIIQRLAASREEIAEKSRSAVQFARLHDFETTFQKRMNHLAGLVR